MSTIKANAILDASGGNTTTINGTTPNAYNTMGKNRIINGAMEIDQRNAGASVTNTNGSVYPVDRFPCWGSAASKYTAQQSSTAPSGFVKSLLITSSSAYSVGLNDYFGIQHRIEGFNIADLGWGTADAKAITLTFKVRSSLTGTFGGSLKNADNTRSYPFSYTISSANTWETKTLTIAGDTSGTWLSTNEIGIQLTFSLGMGSTFSGTAGSWASANYWSATGATSVVGTSGATFYITGVQLEVGSVATEFERRPYGTELALCQRYYTKSFNTLTAPSNGSSTTTLSTYYGAYTSAIDRPSTGGPPTANDSTTAPNGTYGSLQAFPVTMRANPSITYYGNSNGNWWLQGVGSGGATWYGPQGSMPGVAGFAPTFASPISTDAIGIVFGHWAASAEL